MDTIVKTLGRTDSIYSKIVKSLAFAGLIGLLAQVKFYLPWTPVPITGSTVGVVLTGIFLGQWALLSVGTYILLGAFGLPWFAGWNGGFAAILGPTGGYLLGFILAAWFIGKVYENIEYKKRFAYILFAHVFLVYIPGILGLVLWYKFTHNSMPGVWKTTIMGVLPFIPGDALKSAILACVPSKKY